MSKGSSQPTVTQTSNLTPGQSSFLDSFYNWVNPQVGKSAETYSGPTTVGASDLQTGGFDLIQQLLSGKAPGQQQMNTALSSVDKPWSASGATDYWNKAIKDPAMDSWKNDIMPSIQEKFAAYDAAGSGGSAKALGDAGMRLETGMQQNLQNYLETDKQTSNAQMLQAAGLTSANNQDILNDALTGGAQQRGINLDSVLADYKKWQDAQPYNNPAVQMGLNGESVNALTNVVTPGQSSSVPGMLGGLGSILGAGGTAGMGAKLAGGMAAAAM